MTLLAALWNYEGRDSLRRCKTMLDAQCGNRGHGALVERNGITLGRGAHNDRLEQAHNVVPIDGASGAFTLIADARLDNRSDYRSPLGLTMAGSAELSDARLMTLCIERWGTGAIDGFVGDFALVLLDRRANALLLARDFAGMRPLFYHEGGGELAIASMAKGLHALDSVSRGVDPIRMRETLVGLPHEGRRTFFKNIERVEPGEVLTFDRGRRSARIFWNPPRSEVRLRADEEYAEALLEKLDLAVDARLVGSAGTVGTHLSAGLDSSAVTTSAALHSRRVLAFTSIPSGDLPSLPAGRFGDESVLAAQTAAMYSNIEHRLVSTGSVIPLQDLSWELELFERPDLNLPNLIWGNKINEAAQDEGIHVMLIGTAGNASISYGGAEVLQRFLSEGRVGTFFRECLAARSFSSALTIARMPIKRLLPRSFLRTFRRYRNGEQHQDALGVLNRSAACAAPIVARVEQFAEHDFGSSIDVRMQMIRRVDPATYHKGALLRWDVDLRDPTADRRVVEFCLQIPLEQYFRNGTPRALVRRSLKGRIPEDVRCDVRRGLQSANWFSMLSGARDESKRLLAGIAGSDVASSLLDIQRMRHLLDSWPETPDSFGPAIYRSGFLRGISAGEFIRLYSTDE